MTLILAHWQWIPFNLYRHPNELQGTFKWWKRKELIELNGKIILVIEWIPEIRWILRIWMIWNVLKHIHHQHHDTLVNAVIAIFHWASMTDDEAITNWNKWREVKYLKKYGKIYLMFLSVWKRAAFYPVHLLWTFTWKNCDSLTRK